MTASERAPTPLERSEAASLGAHDCANASRRHFPREMSSKRRGDDQAKTGRGRVGGEEGRDGGGVHRRAIRAIRGGKGAIAQRVRSNPRGPRGNRLTGQQTVLARESDAETDLKQRTKFLLDWKAACAIGPPSNRKSVDYPMGVIPDNKVARSKDSERLAFPPPLSMQRWRYRKKRTARRLSGGTQVFINAWNTLVIMRAAPRRRR